MKTTSTRIDEDIAALMRDLCRLRTDFAEAPNRIRSYGRDKIMRSREGLRATVLGLQDRAKDRVRDTSSVLKGHGRYAVEKWRDEVQYRPIASLGVAFVAGLLFASVVAHRCRWH